MTFHNLPHRANPVWVIHTDGSCKFNPGPGGWAYVVKSPCGVEAEHSGGLPRTTNNRMEMIAAIEALKTVPERAAALIVTDSKLVQQGASEWMPKWKSNGWKNSAKKPVLNQNLWLELDALLQTRSVRFEWGRGHCGHVETERADALAADAAEAQHGLQMATGTT